MKGTLVSFGFAALVWEAFARSGLFPAVATPSLLAIGGALVAMIADGTLFVHVLYTLYRIVVGLALAAIVGVPLGMLMGRFGSVERFVLPLVSVLNPIPSLAWVPVFIMWSASATPPRWRSSSMQRRSRSSSTRGRACGR